MPINYSFIIPHKNTPTLLQKAIDSIPHWEDVEILVIDDNSDPAIVDFDKFPGYDDKNVKLFLTKEGKGAGYARNIGLSKAQGKWILFLDADDYFHPALKDFLIKYKDTDNDIIVWKTDSIDVENGKTAYRGETLNEFTQEAIETGNFENVLLISTPCKGMYSREFLFKNNINFEECRWGNDVVFSSKVAVNAKKCAAADIVVECITSHQSFGLISNHSLKSAIIRYQQEYKSIRLVKKKFKGNSNIHKWFFDTWYAMYKKNRISAIIRIPSAIIADDFNFIKTCLKSIRQFNLPKNQKQW